MVTDFMRYYIRTTISYGCRFHEILHHNHKISWLDISWDQYKRTTITHRCRFHDRDITPKPQYLMVAYFMRYNNINTISHGCRIYEILHQIHNISWLQNLWDITPVPQYLMVADFVRYNLKTPIYRGCRFLDILHQIYNISWLLISWDIIQ